MTYLHPDHLGTPKFGTNAGGTQVWAWAPDAFGGGSPSGAATVNLRMPGQFFDAESSLFYNWNRYYNPATGRYISSDPIGLEGGINTFLYAAANPVMAIDPDGNQTIPMPWGGALSGSRISPMTRPGGRTIDPTIALPDTGTPDPNQEQESQRCQSLKKRIENIRKDISKREQELADNPGNLPERLPPGARLSEDRRGHRIIVRKLERRLKELEDDYYQECACEPPT